MQTFLILLLCLGQQIQPVNTPPSFKPYDSLPVKGSIEYHGVQRVVNLWGTHYEMGYAHGYLLGDEIMMGFEDYFLVVPTTPWKYTNIWLPFVKAWYFQLLPDEYKQEMKGMLQGMIDAGTDLYVESLGRNAKFIDALAANLMFDLQAVHCSSTFGWGGATADDPMLQGGPVIAHNNDYVINHPFTDEHSVIFVFQSTSPHEKGFVSIALPGFVQVINGFNLDGVGAFLHNSNHGGYDPTPLYGIGFAIRDGLEDKDSDSDGYETYLDIYNAISSRPTINAFNIGLISPYPVPGYPDLDPAAILEINHWGYALRDASHNMDYTPYLNSQELLAVTNHFRLLHPPIYCWRYNYQVTQLSIDFKVDTDELWQIQSGIANKYTLQMMAFRPNQLDFFVAFNETGQGAHNSQKNYYKLEDLFPNH
jgi:hypothetical protein